MQITDNQEIAKSIKELRKALKYTQDEFAKQLGLTKSAISKFETGSSTPSYITLQKIAALHRQRTGQPQIISEKEFYSTSEAQGQNISPYPANQTNTHAVGLLSDIPVIKLRRVSFKARASFGYMQMQRYKDSDIFDTVLFRLPPGRTEEDYKDALVFDIEGDSMEPSLRDGQQVIAWPVPEGRWEYLHNTICVAAYAEEVTVKAIFKNELNNMDGLTLHATGGPGGSFTVERKDINSIWEVREFYGVVPVRLLP